MNIDDAIQCAEKEVQRRKDLATDRLHEIRLRPHVRDAEQLVADYKQMKANGVEEI